MIQSRTAPRRDPYATAPAFSSLADELNRLTPWADRAACRDSDLNFIEAQGSGAVLNCLELCAVCPVRRDCLDHALAHPEDYGVWGGTVPRDRRKVEPDDAGSLDAGFDDRLASYHRRAEQAAYRRELARRKATATRLAKKATEMGTKLSGTRSA